MRTDTATRPLLMVVPKTPFKTITVACGKCDQEFTHKEGVALRLWAAHRLSAHRVMTDGEAA